MDSGFIRPPEKDPLIDLSSLEGGNVFHFGNITTEHAVAEDALYMVICTPVNANKDGRVKITSMKDGLILERDGMHKVRYLPSAKVLIHYKSP